MRYDPALPIAVWRALMAKAMEDLENRAHECEELRKQFLTEDDVALIRKLVYGAAGMIIFSVFSGMVAAGVLFATSGGVTP